jgi:molybdopterin synthase catalytic subunit
MTAIRIARISDTPLDIAAHLAAVEDRAMGAVASFVGTVRDHDPEAAAPSRLEYSAHPDAEATLHDIALAAISTRRAAVAVSHRSGASRSEMPRGDRRRTPHRDEAFTICREIIEAIKRELPVWKRQLTDDGAATWKGIGG